MQIFGQETACVRNILWAIGSLSLSPSSLLSAHQLMAVLHLPTSYIHISHIPLLEQAQSSNCSLFSSFLQTFCDLLVNRETIKTLLLRFCLSFYFSHRVFFFCPNPCHLSFEAEIVKWSVQAYNQNHALFSSNSIQIGFYLKRLSHCFPPTKLQNVFLTITHIQSV